MQTPGITRLCGGHSLIISIFDYFVVQFMRPTPDDWLKAMKRVEYPSSDAKLSLSLQLYPIMICILYFMHILFWSCIYNLYILIVYDSYCLSQFTSEQFLYLHPNNFFIYYSIIIIYLVDVLWIYYLYHKCFALLVHHVYYHFVSCTTFRGLWHPIYLESTFFNYYYHYYLY